MALRTAVTTPWVRRYLQGDPDQALQLEALRQTTPVDGLLGLFGRSPTGPWQAIVNAPDAPLDGWRGTGPTVLDALRVALRTAEETAA